MYRLGLITSVLVFVFVGGALAQADDICREFGETPSREVGRDNRLVPFVYGRVVIANQRTGAKTPRITVSYSDSVQPARRQVIDRSGNYCFPRRGTSGVLLVELDGEEVSRRSVSDISVKGQREDFEIMQARSDKDAAPGVITTKFTRPPNDKTVEFYKKAGEAEANNEPVKAIEYVRQIVVLDPEDFIAWTKLGSLRLVAKSYQDAENAIVKALVLRPDYASAWVHLGMLRAAQNRYDSAIQMFQAAIANDEKSAIAYRLLGEAYLQIRQGNLALAALDKAVEIDPVGMAECHLLKARLFDLANAKPQAAAEYKAFLIKVPDHPDRKTFEKYIKDNAK